MSTPTLSGTFPDVELALCEYLADIAETFTASAEELVIPFILINRTGGGTDRLGLFDSAVVEVQCFADTRPDSKQLNDQVRARLAGARLVATEAGLLDRITENTAPIQIPYAVEDVRRVTSSWVVATRLIE